MTQFLLISDWCRLCINSLSTLLGVLATQQRRDLMESVLPALVRICSAFPPLLEDCLQLLVIASNMFSATSADNHVRHTNYISLHLIFVIAGI